MTAGRRRFGITGVAGFIGSHLADALLARGDHVVGVDDFSTGQHMNLGQARGCERFLLHELDVRDGGALTRALQDVDVIVHLAARKIPRYGNALETLDVNTLGGRNVLELARTRRCPVIVASTSDIYGKNTALPFAEVSDAVLGTLPALRWPYAISKLFIEQLAFAYHASYRVPVTVLRFFNSYGPRQHLSWRGGPQSVFISSALKGEPLEIHGDGRQTRCFIYIDDLIDGIVRAVDHKSADAAVFNLGNPEEVSIRDLALMIAELCDCSAPPALHSVAYETFGAGYEEVARRAPDISHARRELGFDPKVGLREGLRLTIAWQRLALARSAPV